MTDNHNQPAKFERKPNRLISEKSPYLLQHAYNPVDWYPWGTEAFEKARKENKPIFLSIGYSSCHWCHVFAHESFEDEDIAKQLNENFVCIKVDREERPDVDEIYMKAVMSITGSGGWPLTVFLTPKLEPFYGGTYFPKTPSHGLPGFSNLLRNISQGWRSDRKKISDSGVQMKMALNESYSKTIKSESELDDSVLQDCYNSLAASYDTDYGGFSNSPKFPTPSNLFYLLRYHKLKNSNLALSMVTKTLDTMAMGGICDQIGGGFHRYSTDRYWLVPHFEKMLYDNALLVVAYLEAFLVTKKEEYVATAREILEWVLREMTSKEGGFYSAQDADSPEGEGSYYVWNKEEVHDALNTEPVLRDKLDLISKYFSISSQGNFEDGKTILTTVKPIESLASESGLSEKEFRAIIDRSKVAMLTFRNKRPKPLTDDKILTCWNGLMISAMSKAYSTLGEDKYLESARRAADFTLKSLTKIDEGKPRLIRRYREGEAKGVGVLEDYSYLINGLIDLYEASFEPNYLLQAVTLCNSMIELFYDKNGGGFYQTVEGSSDLIVRMKDAFDGATPSGNSVAALACLRLSEITGRGDLRNAAEGTFRGFWDSIKAQPYSFTEMLVTLMFFLGKPKEIVVSGDLKSQDTRTLIETLRSQYLPNSVVLLSDRALEAITELVAGRLHREGEPSKVYVCSNFTCKLPSSTREQLLSALSE